MKIYSYYQDVPDLPRGDELRLTIQWRQHWAAAGWEPVVLNEWHAQQHPYYQEYHDAVAKLPSCNPGQYELACWLRWLALGQAGGGWMADYDVFPQASTTSDVWHMLTGAEMNRVIVFQTPCCPCMVYCNSMNALQLCQLFATGKLGNRPQEGKGHFSDQYALEDIVNSGERDIINVEVRDVVKHYSDTDWKSAPLVHFPNAVLQPARLTPKWKHVPTLLQGL
jgi:hypothetical protein